MTDSLSTPTPIVSTGEPRPPELRELNDPKSMRALTHPVRLALLEVLALEGPLTATQAGELIGESPTTCSFHFRQLAKYGFVEEAGGGVGRERPWKIVHLGLRFSDANDDPELDVAAKSLERMVFERGFARLQQFFDAKSNFPKAWQEASESSQVILFATSDELGQLNADVLGLLSRFHERLEDKSLRPDDALPVEVLMFSYPVRPPGGAT
ncbi:MAG: winged helix-turn-helix domain-containing protein [Acidimicrobiales bacterium]